jgi:hypothetical protein
VGVRRHSPTDMLPAILTDRELADICRPLKQGAAQIRYLRGIGVPVERRLDGTPLVRRVDWERAQNASPAARPKWRVPA